MREVVTTAIFLGLVALLMSLGPKSNSRPGGGGAIRKTLVGIAKLPSPIWRWLIIPGMIATAMESVIAYKGGETFSFMTVGQIYCLLVFIYALFLLLRK